MYAIQIKTPYIFIVTFTYEYKWTFKVWKDSQLIPNGGYYQRREANWWNRTFYKIVLNFTNTYEQRHTFFFLSGFSKGKYIINISEKLSLVTEMLLISWIHPEVDSNIQILSLCFLIYVCAHRIQTHTHSCNMPCGHHIMMLSSMKCHRFFYYFSCSPNCHSPCHIHSHVFLPR